MKKLIVLTILNITLALVMVHKVHQWRDNSYIQPWDNTAIVYQT